MANGINGIGGNNNSYNYYQNLNNNEAKPEEQEQVIVNNHEETQIDPSKVMDFMAANNFFVAPKENVGAGQVDEMTQERIGEFMKNFEFVFGLVSKEFGEDLAPMVMDMVMDNLIAQFG